jgi:7-cyano-7-deazaguanine synthase
VTRKAVVLLSGGLDSTTVLAMARADGFACHALTFRYGQRHHIELEAAARVARTLGAEEHRVVEIDLASFGGSALTAVDIPVPKNRTPGELAEGVPVTYVPARNTLFLSYALAWAEVLPARDVHIGVNVLDASGYPDCRPEFVAAFERAARLGSRLHDLRIHAPLVTLTKAEIIRRGVALGVDYALTHSCYDPRPNGAACGLCDACQLRRKGFGEAGVVDPTRYG